MENIYLEEGEYLLWEKDCEKYEPALRLHLQIEKEKFRSGKKQAVIARETKTGKRYFLKVLFCGEIEQVFVEKESKVKLYSPYVIRIYGGMLEEEKKRFITAMEYVDVPDLSDLIREQGLLGDSWGAKMFCAHKIARKILEGIHYYSTVYEHDPYVHRDIKPENIMVSPDGKLVKITDFDWVHLHESRMTVHMGREQKGTAGYADPKYWSSSICKKEMDIYSAGLVLYFLYTGRHHFYGNEEINRYMEADEYAYTLKAMPGIDEELKQIIAKMIAPEEVRYHEIGQVIEDFDFYLARIGYNLSLKEKIKAEEGEKELRFSYKINGVKYTPYVKNYRFLPIIFGRKQVRSQNGADSAHIMSFYRMDNQMRAVILHEGCSPIKIQSEDHVSAGDIYVYAGVKLEVVSIR